MKLLNNFPSVSEFIWLFEMVLLTYLGRLSDFLLENFITSANTFNYKKNLKCFAAVPYNQFSLLRSLVCERTGLKLMSVLRDYM